MSPKDKHERVLSALLASVANAVLVVVLFLGMLQLPGRDPNRIVWIDEMGWFIYLFPPLNLVCSVLGLFSAVRPRLRLFTWATAAGGTVFAVYLALALFVFY